MSGPVISVKGANALDFPSDVLVLKHAQEYYGVDDVAAQRLKSRAHNYPSINPRPGDHVILSSKGQVASKNVLFVGVPTLSEFGYPEIREFAVRAMRILADELPEISQVSMTMHGIGYGLDEREAFLAQIGGLVEAFEDATFPSNLKQVMIIELDRKRVQRLRRILAHDLPRKYVAASSRTTFEVSSKSVTEAGVKTKPHVFVAMPFAEEMEDVYIFGIEAPSHSAGYLCERLDMSIFTGDILSRIKARIETASLVIADITGANANVYLEVGYAWGKDRPTLLIAKKGEVLNFDVQGQRCIIYKNINDLAKTLEKNLRELRLGEDQ